MFSYVIVKIFYINIFILVASQLSYNLLYILFLVFLQSPYNGKFQIYYILYMT